jgi:phosphinothricin acetyltransferase
MADTLAALHIRDAQPDDMAEVARIYGHYVETSTFTFEEVPLSTEEMRARLRQVKESRLPWRVAEKDGAVIGYVYASRFRARTGYRFAVENSVYVAAAEAQRGVGLALMRDLIRDCAALGYRQMMAVIGDSANEASLRLHTRLGFRTVGHEVAIGLKFGRWIDVVQMQLALGDGARSLPAKEPAGYARG